MSDTYRVQYNCMMVSSMNTDMLSQVSNIQEFPGIKNAERCLKANVSTDNIWKSSVTLKIEINVSTRCKVSG